MNLKKERERDFQYHGQVYADIKSNTTISTVQVCLSIFLLILIFAHAEAIIIELLEQLRNYRCNTISILN